ncbi:MAG TPA: type II secretion system protein N [Allosphingosinicella sp.]
MTQASETGAIALPARRPGLLDPPSQLLPDQRPRNRFSPSLPLLRQSAGRLLRHLDRHPGLYLARATELALGALIAYQCATLLSVIVTPLDSRPDRAAPPPRLAPAARLGSFDPFFTAASAAAAPIAATGLTLHGLRRDGRTGGGSAIIGQSGGPQRSFGVGEDIAPGLVLKQVGSDHVIIVRNGMDERLAFEAFGSTGPAATTAARPVQSPFGARPAASPAAGVPPRRPAPRAPGVPARSIDFADPSTLPASLTTPPR